MTSINTLTTTPTITSSAKFTPKNSWIATPLFDLEGGTYEEVQYELLPTISTNFIDIVIEKTQHIITKEVSTSHKNNKDRVNKLTIPPKAKLESFIKFFNHPHAVSLVESLSPTACYFKIEKLEETRDDIKGNLIKFYVDQQECVIWYIEILENGNHCVWADDNICAFSFEEFINRVVIENETWYYLYHREDKPFEFKIITKEDSDQYVKQYKENIEMREYKDKSKKAKAFLV
jgi:hypothetical protein